MAKYCIFVYLISLALRNTPCMEKDSSVFFVGSSYSIVVHHPSAACVLYPVRSLSLEDGFFSVSLFIDHDHTLIYI